MDRYSVRWGLGWKTANLAGVPLAQEEKASKSSLDHLRNLLAAVSLIAYIITQLSDKHPAQSKVLLGLTIFLVVAAFYPTLGVQAKRWGERRKDNAVAEAAFPKFRKFVHRFGEFIDSRRNDTLHSIVLNEILARRADANSVFRLSNMGTWNSWWTYYWQKVDRQPRTMTELSAALMEFHSLVGSYTINCVTQIFEAPLNVRAEIPLDAKASLNSFQQRFERFLGEYGQFAKSLSESRPVLNELPCWFNTPKPLL